ncbi:MAG: alpha/beta hydrolase [Armatimonadota bacterium]|nr:prolyl oligopeptidase family serine peptidase [Fimbriimonadaceae bacterium]
MAFFAVVCAALTLAQPTPAAQREGLLAPPAPVPFGRPEPRLTTEYWTRTRIQYDSPRPSGQLLNDVVLADFTLPTDRLGKVPVVILLHYWGATDHRVEMTMADHLARRGIASLSLTLPYHMERAPAGTRSGELAVPADPEALRQVMAQSVADIRRACDWIATRPELDSTRIGLGGTSLGAIVASLTFAVEPRIHSVSLLLGGADLAGIYWNSSRTVVLRNRLRDEGWSEDRLREYLKDIEPLNYLQADDPRPIFVVRARFDTVVPPFATDRLLAAIPNAKVLTLETGHYGGGLVYDRLMSTFARFFESTFGGNAFQPPSNFFSPTLRMGVLAAGDEPANFFVGLDLWRTGSKGEAFASLMGTPQGVRGFIGARVGSDIGLGLVLIPGKEPTWGAIWNIVF